MIQIFEVELNSLLFLPASIFFGLTTCKRLKNTHFFFSLFHNLFFHLIFLNPTPSKPEEGGTTERRIKCERRGKAYIWLFLHIFKIFMIFLILQILKANYLTFWALWWVFGRILCRVPYSKTSETWAGPYFVRSISTHRFFSAWIPCVLFQLISLTSVTTLLGWIILKTISAWHFYLEVIIGYHD